MFRFLEELTPYIISLVTFTLAGGLFRTIAKKVGSLDGGQASTSGKH